MIRSQQEYDTQKKTVLPFDVEGSSDAIFVVVLSRDKGKVSANWRLCLHRSFSKKRKKIRIDVYIAEKKNMFTTSSGSLKANVAKVLKEINRNWGRYVLAL